MLNDNMTIKDEWNIVTTKITDILSTNMSRLSLLHQGATFPGSQNTQSNDVKGNSDCTRKEIQPEIRMIGKSTATLEFFLHKQLRSGKVSHISLFLTISIADSPTSFRAFI